MKIRVASDRKDFVERKHRKAMNNIMAETKFVPVGLNGERTDLTNLADVQQDIRDRFGLNVMGATPRK